MFQVLVGLDAAVLRPLVVDGARGVEEGHVAIPACAQVNLLQLQLVRGVQVLFGVPEHAPVQDLPCGGRDKEGQVKFPTRGNTTSESAFRRVWVAWERLCVTKHGARAR